MNFLKQYDYLIYGFVKVTLIAISERLNIFKILTIDRRHFTFVKPKHCSFLAYCHNKMVESSVKKVIRYNPQTE